MTGSFGGFVRLHQSSQTGRIIFIFFLAALYFRSKPGFYCCKHAVVHLIKLILPLYKVNDLINVYCVVSAHYWPTLKLYQQTLVIIFVQSFVVEVCRLINHCTVLTNLWICTKRPNFYSQLTNNRLCIILFAMFTIIHTKLVLCKNAKSVKFGLETRQLFCKAG